MTVYLGDPEPVDTPIPELMARLLGMNPIDTERWADILSMCFERIGPWQVYPCYRHTGRVSERTGQALDSWSKHKVTHLPDVINVEAWEWRLDTSEAEDHYDTGILDRFADDAQDCDWEKLADDPDDWIFYFADGPHNQLPVIPAALLAVLQAEQETVDA